MLCDREIRELATQGMINPFINEQIGFNENGEKVISYGLTSFGYDIRLSPKFKVFNPRCGTLIDPVKFDKNILIDEEGDYCIIAPNSYLLGNSLESFHMPNNVVADCLGKSTYARSGIIINVTPLEPGWIGHLTIEISNATPLPVKVYANMGIAQLRFFKGERPDVTYQTRKNGPGKYQNQANVPVPAIV